MAPLPDAFLGRQQRTLGVVSDLSPEACGTDREKAVLR